MFSWFKSFFKKEEDPLLLTQYEAEELLEDTEELMDELEEIEEEKPDPAAEHQAILKEVAEKPKGPSEDRDDEDGRTISEIIIHCSATRADNDIGVDQLRLMHTTPKPHGRGWKDVGYHYVIRRNGVIELGRDLNNNGLVDDDIGAHAFGWNTTSIGICLIGGADIRGRGEANFTPAQMTALAAFLVAKRQQYPKAKILGHRDTGAQKDCPSFNVGHWLRTGQMIEPMNFA